MKTCKSLFVMFAVLIFAAAAFAQGPAIGVFFDVDGTQSSASLNGGVGEIHTAYVCAVDVEMMVGGASFKLVMDPQILLLTATYPPGLAIGEITEGVDLGLSDPLPAFGGGAAVLATVQLTTFDNLLDNAPLTITNSPGYATPIVADSQGYLFAADGQTGYLSIPVAAESMTMSQVKSLFQ